MVKVTKAVFLDRDGVLNVPIIIKKKSYAPTKLKDFRLYPKVARFCKMLKQKGFLLIVITNQPDYRKKKISLTERKVRFYIIFRCTRAYKR